MTNTVTVELTQAEARELARFVLDAAGQEWKNLLIEDAGKKIRAALPPEYPEGTVAWIHAGFGEDSRRYLCELRGGEWRHGMRCFYTSAATRVEPLRVLADDEIAVKRPEVPAPSMRYVAGLARNEHYLDTAEWLTAVAAAMEKK